MLGSDDRMERKMEHELTTKRTLRITVYFSNYTVRTTGMSLLPSNIFQENKR